MRIRNSVNKKAGSCPLSTAYRKRTRLHSSGSILALVTCLVLMIGLSLGIEPLNTLASSISQTIAPLHSLLGSSTVSADAGVPSATASQPYVSPSHLELSPTGVPAQNAPVAGPTAPTQTPVPAQVLSDMADGRGSYGQLRPIRTHSAQAQSDATVAHVPVYNSSDFLSGYLGNLTTPILFDGKPWDNGSTNMVQLQQPGEGTSYWDYWSEYDSQLKKPTLSLTYTCYKLAATDLGVPFRHHGRTYLLFGDTIGARGGDAIAFTTDTNPENGLKLEFIYDASGTYKPIIIPGISQGNFDVPMEGVSVGGRMYIYNTTDASSDADLNKNGGYKMGRSVLAVSDDDGSDLNWMTSPEDTLSLSRRSWWIQPRGSACPRARGRDSSCSVPARTGAATCTLPFSLPLRSIHAQVCDIGAGSTLPVIRRRALAKTHPKYLGCTSGKNRVQFAQTRRREWKTWAMYSTRPSRNGSSCARR